MSPGSTLTLSFILLLSIVALGGYLYEYFQQSYANKSIYIKKLYLTLKTFENLKSSSRYKKFIPDRIKDNEESFYGETIYQLSENLYYSSKAHILKTKGSFAYSLVFYFEDSYKRLHILCLHTTTLRSRYYLVTKEAKKYLYQSSDVFFVKDFLFLKKISFYVQDAKNIDEHLLQKEKDDSYVYKKSSIKDSVKKSAF